jgi:2-dehydro-3-deoxyphosphooctonate aldolase (KDO 8-P synthase)
LASAHLKTSYDKANRTSLSGKRGIGLDAAMAVFADIKAEFGLARPHRCA